MVTPNNNQLIDLIATAIRDAHINDPNTSAGTMWDNLYLSNEEAVHYAKAALNVLAQLNLKITEAS
jgi:hypothetical protein